MDQQETREKSNTHSKKQAQLIEIIQSNIESFKNVDSNDIDIKKLTGLTNETYRIKNSNQNSQDQKPNVVLLRIFGACEGLIDQEKENEIFIQLGNLGIGPKCYKCNPGKWRIEEFIETGVHPDHEVLRSQKFRDLIAIYLANFHQSKLDIKQEEPLVDFYLKNQTLFQQFLDKCDKKELFSQQELEQIEIIKKLIEPECLEFLEKVKPKTNIHLCHNDANNLNIFFNEGVYKKQVLFIDYEYARTNYAAFDIANFMGENCLNYNVDKDPYFKYEQQNEFTDAQIERFAKLYLFISRYPQKFEELEKQISECTIEKEYNQQINDFINHQVVKFDQEEQNSFAKEVQTLTQEIHASQILTSWYWALWSVLTSKPEIEMDFNHIQHGIERVRLVNYFKEKYINLYMK